MKYTITIIAENKLGVLYRIADLFLRKRINIESLTVRETDAGSHESKFVVKIRCEEHVIQKIINQIERVVEVKSVRFV